MTATKVIIHFLIFFRFSPQEAIERRKDVVLIDKQMRFNGVDLKMNY